MGDETLAYRLPCRAHSPTYIRKRTYSHVLALVGGGKRLLVHAKYEHPGTVSMSGEHLSTQHVQCAGERALEWGAVDN